MMVYVITQITSKKHTKFFTLHDLYEYEFWFANKFPNLNESKAAIRANIQRLRKKGWVEFVDFQGEYKLTDQGMREVQNMKDSLEKLKGSHENEASWIIKSL